MRMPFAHPALRCPVYGLPGSGLDSARAIVRRGIARVDRTTCNGGKAGAGDVGAVVEQIRAAVEGERARRIGMIRRVICPPLAA